MAEQTIVAVYDTAAHAENAVKALQAANVPPSAISRHAADTATGVGTAAAQPLQERGFWASLFGGDTDDADTYGRSVASGSSVVTVKVPEEHALRVVEILEAHDPVDLDERAASYGTTQATPAAARMPAQPATATAPAARSTAQGSNETIQVVEERLSVGKRAVNQGGARVRSYVVETPVEERVTLRDETVHVERRPVTDGRPVTDADFRERSVEMRTTSEEAVVNKEARVVEEISLRKEATEHVETVRDTVRRTQVDVDDKLTGERSAAMPAGARPGATPSAANPASGPAPGTRNDPPGTEVTRALDKAVGTNTSGTNPGANAPDGTPGNPSGTMASRAVDKTVGTNISGANPTGKL